MCDKSGIVFMANVDIPPKIPPNFAATPSYWTVGRGEDWGGWVGGWGRVGQGGSTFLGEVKFPNTPLRMQIKQKGLPWVSGA